MVVSLVAEHGILDARASVVVAPGLQRTESVVVAYGLSYPAACGIFPDQGLNPCPLHWQADSLPLDHQGSLRQGSYLSGSLLLNQCLFLQQIHSHFTK